MVRYGKPFRKKTAGGKHRKGTMIKYKYSNRGKKIGAVKHGRSNYSGRRKYGRTYRRY